MGTAFYSYYPLIASFMSFLMMYTPDVPSLVSSGTLPFFIAEIEFEIS